MISQVQSLHQFIDAEKAQKMISTWQLQLPESIFSILYGRHVFDSLLAIPNCEGISIFNGINDDGKQAFVLIGTGPEGFLFIDIPFDMGNNCPVNCPNTGDLTAGFLWRRVPDHSMDITKVGKQITKMQATEMIARWGEQLPVLFLSGRAEMEALLAVPGCAGIIIYNAINEEGNHTLLLLATDKTGVIIPKYTVETADGLALKEGLILELK